MKIIKLNAIDSTNSFLKELAQSSSLEDYTSVVTNDQTNGRGQMQHSWISEPNKNLTFSIFTTLKSLLIQHQSYLNFATTLALFEVLNDLKVPNLAIKWPNDIMSEHYKICGVLIETTYSKQKIKNTIIGIGLNVNQENFPAHIPHANSLKNILGKELELEPIMIALIKKIQSYIRDIESKKFDAIYQGYLLHLYKKGIPSTFKNEISQHLFMGIIQGVSKSGHLLVQLEDDSIVEFDVKEISLAKV